jgi:YD repeat-containing protein
LLAYPGGRVLAYSYDASGGCTNIAESGASLASFDYIGADRLALVTYGNGLHSSFEYDGRDGVQNDPGDHGFGQVSHVVHVSTNGTKVKTSHLSWDLKQNKAARIIPPTGTGGSTNVLTLAYDRADRLVHATVTEGTTTLRDTTYGLDRMGNRTNVTGAACSGPYTLDSAFPPADYQMNQYTATPCDSRSYDNDGNLVSRSSLADGALTVYTYDYADRLVEVLRVVDGGTGVPSTNRVASYTYDALGRRASKTVHAGEPTPVSRILRMVYDRACVIEEREDSAVVSSYVHVADDRGLIGLRTGNTDYFVLADDQGNAVALTDTDGLVVEGYDYDDYGAVTFLASDGTPTSATSSAFGNPYCWGGLRLDAETGLHNDDGGVYFEPPVGRAVRGKIRMVKDQGNGNFSDVDSSASVAAKHYITIPHDRRVPGGSSGNNPWTGGTPLGMKKGTVKFFNDTKSFGRANQQKLDLVLNLIR